MLLLQVLSCVIALTVSKPEDVLVRNLFPGEYIADQFLGSNDYLRLSGNVSKLLLSVLRLPSGPLGTSLLGLVSANFVSVFNFSFTYRNLINFISVQNVRDAFSLTWLRWFGTLHVADVSYSLLQYIESIKDLIFFSNSVFDFFKNAVELREISIKDKSLPNLKGYLSLFVLKLDRFRVCMSDYNANRDVGFLTNCERWLTAAITISAGNTDEYLQSLAVRAHELDAGLSYLFTILRIQRVAATRAEDPRTTELRRRANEVMSTLKRRGGSRTEISSTMMGTFYVQQQDYLFASGWRKDSLFSGDEAGLAVLLTEDTVPEIPISIRMKIVHLAGKTAKIGKESPEYILRCLHALERIVLEIPQEYTAIPSKWTTINKYLVHSYDKISACLFIALMDSYFDESKNLNLPIGLVRLGNHYLVNSMWSHIWATKIEKGLKLEHLSSAIKPQLFSVVKVLRLIIRVVGERNDTTEGIRSFLNFYRSIETHQDEHDDFLEQFIKLVDRNHYSDAFVDIHSITVDQLMSEYMFKSATDACGEFLSEISEHMKTWCDYKDKFENLSIEEIEFILKFLNSIKFRLEVISSISPYRSNFFSISQKIVDLDNMLFDSGTFIPFLSKLKKTLSIYAENFREEVTSWNKDSHSVDGLERLRLLAPQLNIEAWLKIVPIYEKVKANI